MMKKFSMILLFSLLLALAAALIQQAVSLRYRAEIQRLKGEVAIYQAQAESYARVLRSIRESASSVATIEKAE